MANRVGLYVNQIEKLPIKPKSLDQWMWASDIKDFMQIIENFFKETQELPEIISICHDLTDEHIGLELRRPEKRRIEYDMFKADTGLHCAKFLAEFANEHNLYLNRVCTHGYNSTGNSNIARLINEYYKWKGDTGKSCYNQTWEYEK